MESGQAQDGRDLILERERERLRGMSEVMLVLEMNKYYLPEAFSTMTRQQMEEELVAMKGFGTSKIDSRYRLVSNVVSGTGDASVMAIPGMSDQLTLMLKIMSDQALVHSKQQQEMQIKFEREREKTKRLVV